MNRGPNARRATRSRIAQALAALLIVSSSPSAAGSALIALAIGLAHQHGHQVSLITDQGHVDLVLAHVERAEHEYPAARHGSDLVSESDHVFHLTNGAATSAPRRADVQAPAAALGISAIALPVVDARSHLRPSPQPCAHRRDSSASVVLRL